MWFFLYRPRSNPSRGGRGRRDNSCVAIAGRWEGDISWVNVPMDLAKSPFVASAERANAWASRRQASTASALVALARRPLWALGLMVRSRQSSRGFMCHKGSWFLRRPRLACRVTSASMPCPGRSSAKDTLRNSPAPRSGDTPRLGTSPKVLRRDLTRIKDGQAILPPESGSR